MAVIIADGSLLLPLLVLLCFNGCDGQPSEYPATVPSWASWVTGMAPTLAHSIFDVNSTSAGDSSSYPYSLISWGGEKQPRRPAGAANSNMAEILTTSRTEQMLVGGKKVGRFGARRHSNVLRLEVLFNSDGFSTDSTLDDSGSGDEEQKIRHCSGSLMKNGAWMISAAHCFINSNRRLCTKVRIFGSAKVKDPAAAIDPNSSCHSEEQQLLTELDCATSVKPHPEWDPNILHNDIAVVVLPASLATTISGSDNHLRLPMHYFTYPYLYGKVVGWDRSDKSGQSSAAAAQQHGDNCSKWQLTMADIYVDGNIVCMMTSLRRYLSFYQLCYEGATNDEGVCNGIGGAPIIVSIGGMDHFVGISSIGMTTRKTGSASECSPGTPNVATRVSSYLEWLQTFATN